MHATPFEGPLAHAADSGQLGNALEVEETAVQGMDAAESGQRSLDRRFLDPIVGSIVEVYRLRQDMVRAEQRLTLQAKAILRRLCGGDKVEAEKVWRSMHNGQAHPLAQAGLELTWALIASGRPVKEHRAACEKEIARLAKALPVAAFCDGVPGFGLLALGKTVGELGDLSAYEKGVAGVWKRAGLAVIGEERQRRVAGDAALLHGYSPSRRSAFFTLQDPIIRAQVRKGAEGEPSVPIGDLGAFYLSEKARQIEKGLPKIHAHNRASRHMVKRLLRDLHTAWRHAL